MIDHKRLFKNHGFKGQIGNVIECCAKRTYIKEHTYTAFWMIGVMRQFTVQRAKTQILLTLCIKEQIYAEKRN